MDNIKEILFTNPLFLQDTPEVSEVSNFYLPYSTGFEVECDRGSNFNLDDFTSIPDIIDVNISSMEHRFRIPSGLNGFKCLFKISQALCVNSVFNSGSGIHYHVDFTECYDEITPQIINQVTPFVLEELDTWGYEGTYNARGISTGMSHNWVRMQSGFKTLEYRIGEMTFDYDLLIKRITHVNYISKVIKENARVLAPIIEIIALQKKEGEILSKYSDNIIGVIQKRKVKIGA
jgi:hypothetical protein